MKLKLKKCNEKWWLTETSLGWRTKITETKTEIKKLIYIEKKYIDKRT